jgi:hypothetical protein
VNPNPYAASLASGVNAASDRQRLEQAVDAARKDGAKTAADVSWIMHGPDARPKEPAPKSAPQHYVRYDVAPMSKPPRKPMTPAELDAHGIPVTMTDRHGKVTGHYKLHPEAFAELKRRGQVSTK